MARASSIDRQTTLDRERMTAVVAFTARTLETERPVPFGALIVKSKAAESKTGATLVQTVNAVGPQNDPSCHAELRAVRLGCRKLKQPSLRGYTMYSTCEPCPMCMANLLWASIDRVVYGATIEDANRHCNQIHIPAAEVAARSDMPCEVVGPLERELAYTLFTHPNMLRAFKQWSTRRRPMRATA
jgi:tRNA(Arg) A34 adenosine deaminase TadA